ncbi:hypothetical protein QQF64_005118 [Cirrhinus molitorella]|uniref:Uncharacterized protein n=1 Tax=Cirrhinus molitorella TaxID=172907 RepID=A0ABR3MI83_9TELE
MQQLSGLTRVDAIVKRNEISRIPRAYNKHADELLKNAITSCFDSLRAFAFGAASLHKGQISHRRRRAFLGEELNGALSTRSDKVLPGSDGGSVFPG